MEEHPHTNSVEPSSTEPSTDLLSLPPELILHIFTFVGFENFCQDIRRLAVSKKWYAHARPTFLSTIQLRSDKLRPILLAMEKRPTLAAAVEKATKHIELSLMMKPGFFRRSAPPSPHLPSWIVLDLEELASTLKDFAALRTLIISPRGLPFTIHSSILPSFASLNQLTSLKMDLSDVVFERSPSHHLCESISQLIPRLKVLHCRLPRICNDLLKSPPGGLQELIINIGVSVPFKVEPRHCSEHFLDSYEELRTSLETRLVQFAASMCHPKIVRLIHKTNHDDREYAFDAIEGRRLVFEDLITWDADGVLLPEDWNPDDEIDDEEESDEEESDEEESDEEESDEEESDEEESSYPPGAGEDSDNYRDSGHTDDEEGGDDASDEV